MRSVAIQTPSASYEIQVGRGILDSVLSEIPGVLGSKRLVVITDSTVGDIAGERVAAALKATAAQVSVIEIAPGEQSKSWTIAGDVLEQMVALGLDRASAVVALGGGVIGDLAGFCAAVFMRGIPFAQVPTTLLAQVDSSIGGKTAVDLPAGKNLVGAFAQPRIVVSDTDVLTSLPESEWRSGLAEMVKHAFLGGTRLLEWTEEHACDLAGREPITVEDGVYESVRFKGSVVSADECEAGARESLNYGHTLGHAIETLAGYGTFSHGAAVAEGMRFAARLAERVVGASAEFTQRQERLLDAVGLHELDIAFDPARVLETMKADKKARDGRPRFVLLSEPGEFVVTAVDDEILAEELSAWARRREVGL